MNTTNTLSVTYIFFILTACGGGGGGGSSDPSVTPSSTVISMSNVKQTSADIINSSSRLQELSLWTKSVHTFASNSLKEDPNSFPFSNKQRTGQVEMYYFPESTASRVSGTITITYAGGGKVTSTLDWDNAYDWRQGDVTSMVFSNFDVGNCITNGSAIMTVTSSTTDSLNMLLDNLTLNTEGIIFTGNGNMTMLFDVDSQNMTTMTTSGNSLVITLTSDDLTFTNYNYALSNISNGDYSISSQFTLNDTLSAKSLSAFTGNENVGGGNPTAGEIHITNASDSSQAWLAAQPDGINVEIRVDTDGDNFSDGTVMTTWSELDTL